MNPGQPLELERPRDFPALLNTSFRVYMANFWKLVAIAAAVVIPVDLIVLGLGMEQLFAEYDENPELSLTLLPYSLAALVTAPLVAAMIVTAVLELGQGREPSVGASVQRGLDLFIPLMAALLLALAGIFAGLLLLIVPGIYLAIRWQFVTQSVVVENARGAGALSRSGDLVAGNWWRVFGLVIVTALVAGIPGTIFGLPFQLAAVGSDLAVFALVGRILAEIVSAPFTGVMLTLLYFDLRARQRPGGGAAPPGWPGSPPAP